jgi:acetyl-CoA acetyltransferase
MSPGIGRSTAIIGVGQTEFSKAAGRSETQLASEAIVSALGDAGLTSGEVDGLVSYTIDPVEETELVRALGIPEIAFSSRVPYGGGGSQGVLLHAASAVASGIAEVVVAYRAVKARSGARFGRAEVGARATSQHSGSTAMQWCTPYGVLTPAAWMSLNATRYMHAYGVTNEDFGRAVVQLRAYAASNPNSHFYGKPISLEDHQSSRWIAEPALRLFDCCQETDGSLLLMQLEGLGLCGPGEAKDFVADGQLGPKGGLPCNTNGGLIGEGYIHGMNLTLEAVRQLRGLSVNQVDDARTVLVSASRTGVILQRP